MKPPEVWYFPHMGSVWIRVTEDVPDRSDLVADWLRIDNDGRCLLCNGCSTPTLLRGMVRLADDPRSFLVDVVTGDVEPAPGLEEVVTRCADLGAGEAPWWPLCSG